MYLEGGATLVTSFVHWRSVSSWILLTDKEERERREGWTERGRKGDGERGGEGGRRGRRG